ncbi:YSIRK-type signal peptide-containing protein [Streptococcus suis]|uniref:YSIRK-type signal peptide-containing protein n=1 Tax=Streptococcus suis TaxID=1307 RepID=UPI0037D59A30
MLDKKKVNFRRKRMMTPDKRYRYSIRKFNVGIASVAIAAFMFLGNGAVSVSANELASNEEVIPTSGPVSEEDQSSSTKIKESELVPSSTPNTGTPAETPAQTEKVVAEETVPVTENADSLPTNESQQESLSTKESDDALAAAKKVLEQVISEAEVLSADALRKAAKSTADTSSLQSAANATKAAAEAANQVFADEHASLEDINAQITAIRTAVGNLVPELTSFTGTEEVTVMLAATTSGVADANQSGIDEISERTGQYTAISVTQNFKWEDMEPSPIIALKKTDGTYKYKKFSGTVTVDIAKAAKDEFVDAATYKATNDPLQATDKVYIIQESDFTSAPTSIEESYDLTKFHHRQNLIFGGWSIYEGATAEELAGPDADADSSAFIALARPGSFESEIEFKDASNPGEPSIYLPKENNTVLVADSIDEALRQSEPSYKNFGLFLSHIAVSDDKVNKPNTVMELPKGVEVVFANQNDQQTTFYEAMNEIMAALRYDPDDGSTVLNPQQKLKFKFIVKKDGQIIKEDENWREITLHVYNSSDAVKGLVKTTLTNTQNDFEAGIVDNIDFSGLPEEMKKEAIEMEKTYRNVDGTLPQDGALPEFSNPDDKHYEWINKDGEGSDGTHATSPVRYFPYDMGLFQGEGDKINKKLRGYLPYITDYKMPPDKADWEAQNGINDIPPTEHDKELLPYFTIGSVFTRTMFDRNMTPEPGGVNKSYWNSLVEDMPIPQLDFAPEVNLDIVTLSDSPQPNPKGTVKIVYKALNADGTDVDSSVVLRADVTDTEDAAVGTPWNAAEQEKDEKPETLTHEATNTVYHLVKTAVVVPGVDGESTQTEGTVVAGDTVVTYFYAPEQTETIPTENKAKVTVNYYILDTSTPLQPSYEDTPATKISETVTTNTYYLDANNERVPVGAPKVVTNPVDPAVTYNTTETKNGKEERPTTLESGGKTYHLVETATTFTDGTGIRGNLTKDTVVNYYYAEEQVEEGVIEEKGNVTVKYETEGGTTLKPAYKDSENVLVSSTPTTRRYYLKDGKKVYLDEQPVRGTTTKTDATYDTREDKSATGGVNEKPATLTDESGTTYHLIKTKDETPENGTLPAGDTVVTYVYAPEQTREVPTPSNGSVIVEYKLEGSETPEKPEGTKLQADFNDTTDQLVSTSTVTETYYVDANGVEKVTNTSEPVVTLTNATYEVTKAEAPDILTIGEKTYHKVRVNGTENGTLPAGETKVTYYYAEEQVEEGVIEEKGNVTVKYETEGGTTLKPAYKDSENVLVSSTPTTRRYYLKDGKKVYLDEQPVRGTTTKTDATYDTREDKSATGGVNEKPATLTDESGKKYHLIKTKDKTPENGTLPAGDTVVTYVYAPEQTEIIPTENKAKVTVNYYILGTSTPLQPSYEDTPATKISETVTTNTYYLDANNERVPVGDPAVVTNPVDPAVTYNTTLTKADGTAERPTTLESGGKTYHLVEAATTFTEGTGVSGTLTKDTVVNYYYAEIKDEVTTEPTNGSVTIKYESTDGTPLRDDKEDTSSTVISTKTTTKKYYVYNGEKVYVGDPVESTETVDLSYNTTEEDKDEKPETLQKDGKTYQRVAVKADSADENGKVTGDHVVTYVYAEIKEEVTTEPTNGSVTIKYETTDGTPLRDDKEDTASTVISTKTTTKKYYEYDGQKVYVGDPVESTETVDLSYNTTEEDKDEKPETLQKDGKTYQRVAVKAGSADEKGNVSGELVVTYVYAEVPEEPKPEEPKPEEPKPEEPKPGEPKPEEPKPEEPKPEEPKPEEPKPEEPKPEEPKPEEPKPGEPKPEEPKPEEPKPEEPKPDEPKPEEPKPGEPTPGEPTPPTDGGTTPPTDGGTTPPTDGGVNPPTDGGTTPPTDGGTTPPTDGGTTPPTDGGTTPPTDGGTTPPTDGGTTPPTDGGTTPPTDGGTTPPTDGGTTPPTDGGTTPPTDGGTTPPTDGGTTPPTDGGTTPPTDGGVNPPTDGGVNPPIDGGTTPPTDGGTTPPTDGGTTPPTDGGTTPPTDGGTTPPTDGGTTPPTDGGTTPPTDGGTTPPTDGGTTPPTDGGTTPPTDGGTTPPTDGGTTPPTDGGTTPPTDGGTTPPTDGGTTPPTDGGTTPPTDGGTTPPTDGGTTPPTDGGTTPPTDGGTTPPTDGGTTPPTDGGTTPPTDGGTTPPTDGGTTPPTDGGTTPPTDGGTTPPTDGGTTPTPPTGTITVTPKAGTTQLPNTGEASTSPLYGVLAFATGLAGLFGLVKKKKEEDQ